MAGSEHTISSVLQYLYDHKYFKSLISLEQESNTRLHSYGKELDFLYSLLVEGRFKDAEKFILPLKSRSQEKFEASICLFRRQKFLETVETSESPDLEELVTLLKEVEAVTPKDAFQSLCACLTLSKINDHPDLAAWSVWQGRIQCFQDSLAHMNAVFPNESFASRPPEEVKFTESSETGERSKKSVTFKVEAESPQEVEEAAHNVFIETLEPISPDVDFFEEEEEDSEETEENHEMYAPSGQELMGKFDPGELREVAQVSDTQPIRACCFSDEGDYFVLGTNSKSLKICSLHNIVDGLLYNEHQGREQYIDVVFEMKNVHYGSVYCVDWARSGRLLATGSNDKTIKVISCPDFLTIQENNSQTVVYVDGQFLNADSEIPAIHEKTIRGHQGTVRSVCFMPNDDSILASGGIVDPDLKVWNTETSQCLHSYSGHSGAIYSISASGDANTFVTAGTDKKIRIWDIRAQNLALQLNTENLGGMNAICLNYAAQHIRAEAKMKIAQMYKYKKSDLAQFSNRNLIAAGHCNGNVSLWDVTAGKMDSSHSFHSAECRTVDFSSNAQWLLTGSFDSSLGMIDMKEEQEYKLQPHMDRIVCAKWHPSLPIVLSTSADKTARIFSV